MSDPVTDFNLYTSTPMTDAEIVARLVKWHNAMADEPKRAESKRTKHRQTADLIERLQAEKAAMEGYKDAAYLERNRLVALLSKLFPSGKKRTAIDGWSEDWHGCVYIDFPWGQASWHYHDSQAHLFNHLPEYQGEWDGHTTDEKYAAIAAMGEKL